MKKLLCLLLACISILSLSACHSEKAAFTDTGPGTQVVEQPASTGILSSFSAEDLAGNPVGQTMLENYELTMVNVWATFCGPCLREMPDLGALAEEYRERGIQIIGLVSDVLNSDGSPSESQLQTARDIVAATDADYPHIVPSSDLFGLLSQISSVPTTFFVDKDGRQVGAAYVGANSKEDWAAIIEQTWAEVSQ